MKKPLTFICIDKFLIKSIILSREKPLILNLFCLIPKTESIEMTLIIIKKRATRRELNSIGYSVIKK